MNDEDRISDSRDETVEPDDNGNSPLGWLLPLVLLGLILTLGYLFCSKPPTATKKLYANQFSEYV